MTELYDDGEQDCPGDPDPATFTAEQWVQIERLQSAIDAVNDIDDEDERTTAAAELWAEVEGVPAVRRYEGGQ